MSDKAIYDEIEQMFPEAPETSASLPTVEMEPAPAMGPIDVGGDDGVFTDYGFLEYAPPMGPIEVPAVKSDLAFDISVLGDMNALDQRAFADTYGAEIIPGKDGGNAQIVFDSSDSMLAGQKALHDPTSSFSITKEASQTTAEDRFYEREDNADRRAMTGIVIGSAMSLASILAQIWMTKDAQKHSEEMWDKQAAEARAQMQYNRTGLWPGQVATSSGGGGDSVSTQPTWTPIKPTAIS